MKSLILGGMHGNEPLGVELVELLQGKPLPGVTGVIANPRAVRQNSRLTQSDLNRSFGPGYPGTYETKRAKELTKLCKQYDLVLDFHNTQTPNNDCAFVGPDVNSQLLQLAKRLGLERCIVADYDCVNKACGNALSVEISLDSPLNNAGYWYELLRNLDAERPTKQLNLYRYARRVTWAEKDQLGLDNWQPFKPISQAQQKNLEVDGIIVPIFIGSKYTEYYATLISLESQL